MPDRPPAQTPPVVLDDPRMRALVRTFSDWIWVADPGGGLASDIPEWRAITGQSVDEILGDGWLDGLRPEDRERALRTWTRAVESRGVYDVEYRIAGPGGERWFLVRAAPVLAEDGTVEEWIGTAVDVTDARRARELQERLAASLAAERRVLQQVITQASTAVAVVWGPRHEFRYFNDRYLEIVPAGRVVVGRTVAEALPEAADVIPILDRVLGGETVRFEELAIPFEDERSFEGHRYYQVVYNPIRLEDSPGGVLAVATELTEQVRRRAGLAELVQHERQAAERLQRALLPETVPEIAGLDVAVAYMPAGEEVGVGGDWYDVVELDEGCVLLVIGDICGRGLEAATYMSQMRSAVRAYAVEDAAPARVLERCAAYGPRLGMPAMITVGLGLLDLRAGTLRWSSAGHPPPLVVPAGGEPFYADIAKDPPLGVGGPFRETGIALNLGDLVVLYTDGAVERRGMPIDAGFDALRAALPAVEGAQSVCEALRRHVTAAGPAGDDCALLVFGTR